MFKFLQKNLGRGVPASNLFLQHFIKEQCDLAIISEPYDMSKSLWKSSILIPTIMVLPVKRLSLLEKPLPQYLFLQMISFRASGLIFKDFLF